MKKIILLALSLCLFIAQVTVAQSGKKKPQPKVPPVVSQAFTAKYPNMKVRDWDFEEQKDLYEAKFTTEGKEKEAAFSSNGKWVKTKTDITKTDLPAPVSKAATTGELSAWTMIDFSHVESPDKGTYYKIRFKKGQEEKSLKFDASGKQLEQKNGAEKKPQKS